MVDKGDKLAAQFMSSDSWDCLDVIAKEKNHWCVILDVTFTSSVHNTAQQTKLIVQTKAISSENAVTRRLKVVEPDSLTLIRFWIFCSPGENGGVKSSLWDGRYIVLTLEVEVLHCFLKREEGKPPLQLLFKLENKSLLACNSHFYFFYF